MKKERSGFTRSTGLNKGHFKEKDNLKTGKSWKEPDRPHKQADVLGSMGAEKRLYALAKGSLGAGAVAYTFYRSPVVFAALMVPACLYMKVYENTWRQQQRRYLESQFKEAIQIMAGILSAGYSPENAVTASCQELERLYGAQGMIVREFRSMEEQMKLNRPIEQVIQEFADRSGLEEARRFAQIFRIAKRSGGRIAPIICHTVSIMEDRSQVREEIRTMTASIQFEQKIMNMIPFFMILYIDITSPGFFQVMYETALGRMIMTACLAVYLLSWKLSSRILNISIG